MSSPTKSPETKTPTGEAPEYVFHLYVAGQSMLAQRAIVNVRSTCEQHLKGRYKLIVVDVQRFPERAAAEQLIALPTLVKKFPSPEIRFIGDLSNSTQFLSRIRI